MLKLPCARPMGILLAGLVAACGGPRMLRIAEEPLAPLPPETPVAIYVGEVEPVVREVAIIESDRAVYEDEATRLKQIEQLRAKARALGANAIQEVEILPVQVRGFTPDERTPFKSWKQGEYSLFFMRGKAIVVEEQEPVVLEDVEPAGGWLVETLAPPAKIGMRADGPTTGTTGAPPAPARAVEPAPVVDAPAQPIG